jgi:hypothetical protein
MDNPTVLLEAERRLEATDRSPQIRRVIIAFGCILEDSSHQRGTSQDRGPWLAKWSPRMPEVRRRKDDAAPTRARADIGVRKKGRASCRTARYR